MAQERGLHLDGADTVTGDFDDFIGAPSEPHIAVLVDLRRVSGVIDARDNRPVIAAIAFFFAPQFRRQSWKRPPDHHNAFFVDATRCTVWRYHGCVDAWHG